MRRIGQIARLVTVATIFLSPCHVFAASNDSIPVVKQSSCGTTTADAIRQARHALEQTDKESERAALTCLIEAVSDLETKKFDTVRSDGTHVVAVPVYREGTR